MIRTQNIHFGIKSKRLLEDVSFEARAGEFWAIVGANGAGKSTLMKLLSRELVPTSGEIRFQNKNLSAYKLKELARKRTILAQQNSITLGFSVSEIVMMGRYPFFDAVPTPHDVEIINQCLKKVGIFHFKDRLFPTLSGGEQQRVQLARALAQIWEVEQGLILLDEPTTGMDLLHQYETFQLAREMTGKGFCVIAVIHDLNQALQFADQMLMLKAGRIMSIGKPKDVLTEAHIQEAFGLAVRIINAPETSFPIIVPEVLSGEINS
jgi:iron complex transport system ATP-binding protein